MTTARSLRVFVFAGVAAVVLGACQSSTVDKFPDPGQVVVTVVDQNTAHVAGVTVDLLLPDNGFVWRSAVTDASGVASPGAPDGGVLPGNYNVRVTPPSGYHIASGSPNSVPITVSSNKQVSLTIPIVSDP